MQKIRSANTVPLGAVDGMNMGRAFREGVAPERRVSTLDTKMQNDTTVKDGRMAHIWTRANDSNINQGEAAVVPAMLTIEDDEWVWQQVSPEILSKLSHRLVLHGEDVTPLGGTMDFQTAAAYANHLAKTRGQVVLIEPL